MNTPARHATGPVVSSVEEMGNGHEAQTNSTILHSRKDDIVPSEHSEELVANSGVP
ncbi:MAG: hypothetical protein R3C49_21830 [Planctomycetaceae bacterium]